VTIKDGDKLIIPKKSQDVTILGEVQGPTSHVWQPGLSRDDYSARRSQAHLHRTCERGRRFGRPRGLVPAESGSGDQGGRHDRRAARYTESPAAPVVAGHHDDHLQPGNRVSVGSCIRLSAARSPII
jgi:hypothetical protein